MIYNVGGWAIEFGREGTVSVLDEDGKPTDRLVFIEATYAVRGVNGDRVVCAAFPPGTVLRHPEPDLELAREAANLLDEQYALRQGVARTKTK